MVVILILFVLDKFSLPATFLRGTHLPNIRAPFRHFLLGVNPTGPTGGPTGRPTGQPLVTVQRSWRLAKQVLPEPLNNPAPIEENVFGNVLPLQLPIYPPSITSAPGAARNWGFIQGLASRCLGHARYIILMDGLRANYVGVLDLVQGAPPRRHDAGQCMTEVVRRMGSPPLCAWLAGKRGPR